MPPVNGLGECWRCYQMVDLSLIENAPEDRESLTNLFSQGRYSDFGKQLGQMVTPQSFYGNKLDLDTVLNDFVEFSPYGDVKDAWSAFNPNSGLDWLERTIAALPIVGWGAGATLATRAAMRNIEMRRQLKQQGEAVAASLSTSNELGIEASMVGAEGRLEYPGELSGEDIGFTEETTTAERTNEAARLSAMVWKHTMPEASVAVRVRRRRAVRSRRGCLALRPLLCGRSGRC